MNTANSQQSDAVLARAEFEALASARAGMMCSDGMADRTLAVQWSAVDDAQSKAMHQNLALQKERGTEISNLSRTREVHRREVADACDAKRRILNEMRAVKNKMEDKVLSARARGNHNMGAANRALARAGQNALSARGDYERWQARSQDAESTFAASAGREAEKLSKTQETIRSRTAEAVAQMESREQRHLQLTQEAAMLSENCRQRHEEHCQSQEMHNRRIAELKMQGAENARLRAENTCRSTIAKSNEKQIGNIHAMHTSREDAAAKIAQAQQEFMRRRMECEITLDRERICAAQARKIAFTLKQQQHEECQAEIAKLEAQLEHARQQSQQMVVAFESEAELANRRGQAWSERNESTKVAADARAAKEEECVAVRVDQAKVSLSKLQAQCTAYLRSLQDSWDEAKREDAAKVDAARAQMEQLAAFCEQTLQNCEQYCMEALHNTESYSQAKKEQLESKVSKLDELAKQRITMMQQQSKDKRQKAERQLAECMEHVEKVRAQCADRVKTEAATADEKVELARRRFNEAIALAERRQAEAEARRDKARAAHAAVMSRCMGSAMEARRRGLNNIADIIEPEPPKKYGEQPAVVEPPLETVAAAEQTLTVESAAVLSEAVAADEKNASLMSTGITAASTTSPPEDLNASLETLNELPPEVAGEALPEAAGETPEEAAEESKTAAAATVEPTSEGGEPARADAGDDKPAEGEPPSE